MSKLPAKSAKPRIALVVSRFNEGVTNGLRQGALAYLSEHGVTVNEAHIFPAPGAFETPLLAKKIAQTGKFDGVVCLGCVNKGDTAHFEYISLGATIGLMNVTLETGIPVTFGILTTYNDEQATIRSRNDSHNKGREAAAACLDSLTSIAAIAAVTA